MHGSDETVRLDYVTHNVRVNPRAKRREAPLLRVGVERVVMRHVMHWGAL